MAGMGALPVLGDVTCRQVSAPLSLDLGDSWCKPGPREASTSLEVPLGAVGYSASSPVAHGGLLSAVWGSGVIVASTTFTRYLAHPQNESGVYTQTGEEEGASSVPPWPGSASIPVGMGDMSGGASDFLGGFL